MIKKVCILFGGKSIEHEVSILSLKNFLPFFDRSRYDIMVVGIDREGMWHISNEKCEMSAPQPFYEVFKEMSEWGAEVVFPILHGLNGEDGTIQGLLEIAGIPYVGPNVLAAAIGLDKDVTKRLLRDAGLKVTDFITCTEMPDWDDVVEKLSFPVFVKPVNMGSTLGISKAFTKEEFIRGFAIAKKYDPKVMIEKAVQGREIECSVIGLDRPIASLPAEIETKTGTYSYLGKYFDQTLTNYIYPAKLEQDLVDRIQEMAIQVYQTLCSEIMARVDFFLTEKDELIVNEINTIPGFTYMSMFHRMWEVSGLETPDLINSLIDYAFERFHKRKLLLHTVKADEVLV